MEERMTVASALSQALAKKGVQPTEWQMEWSMLMAAIGWYVGIDRSRQITRYNLYNHNGTVVTGPSSHLEHLFEEGILQSNPEWVWPYDAHDEYVLQIIETASVEYDCTFSYSKLQDGTHLATFGWDHKQYDGESRYTIGHAVCVAYAKLIQGEEDAGNQEDGQSVSGDNEVAESGELQAVSDEHPRRRPNLPA